MFIKVIYPDGTAGKVRSSSLPGMVRSESIVAYLCSEGWIELRRKKKTENYRPERRVIAPYP